MSEIVLRKDQLLVKFHEIAEMFFNQPNSIWPTASCCLGPVLAKSDSVLAKPVLGKPDND